MGLGLAFTDVLTDALMVEHGRPRGLTGAFQAVQWAAIYAASMLVGGGGYLAERRDLRAGFGLPACFPLVSCVMALAFVREPSAAADGAARRATLAAIRAALAERSIRGVAGFIFFWTFSPSCGVPGRGRLPLRLARLHAARPGLGGGHRADADAAPFGPIDRIEARAREEAAALGVEG